MDKGQSFDLDVDAAFLGIGKMKNWAHHFPALDLDGAPEEKAIKLTEHILRLQAGDICLNGQPNRYQARLMALDLVAHFQREGNCLPDSVTRLLAAALGFDPSAMPDPRVYYVGAHARDKKPGARSRAAFFEAEYLVRTGKRPGVKPTSEAIEVSRPAVDKWRGKRSYRQEVADLARLMRARRRR